MNFKQKYNRACKEYENSDFFKRKTIQLKHLDIAKNLVEECLEEQPDDYLCWYLLGLIWYNFSFNSKERSENCEKALKKSIEIRPDYNWSNMYLGHLYFDQRKFEIALSQFEKLSSEYFKELDLYWRVLKYEELILCCKLYLNFEEVEIIEVEKYAESCEKWNEEDIIFTLEIMRCLVELSDNENIDKLKLKTIFTRLKNMLKKTNNDDIFTKEILEIESNL
ncbi:MAG: hypothetical protein K1X72_02425 [Pyrinomonadaceae bacterium]|nr:hypothetical protein [Pyrinomonadaceae bacterium]